MKNTKTHKVVMLPTEKASKISSNPFNLELLSIHNFKYEDKKYKSNKHLYIISNKEIKEGDYCLAFNQKQSYDIQLCDNNELVKCANLLNCKKVISSTDKSITPNSWIPDSFVKAYIESYNNKKPIIEVNLEIETKSRCCGRCDGINDLCVTDMKCDTHKELGCEICYGERESKSIIKTRPDGSIIIHQSKMYSREEVKTLINNFYVDIIIDKKYLH